MKLKLINQNTINIFFISVFVVIAYFNSFDNEFSYDDNYLILNNPQIESIENYIYTPKWFKLFDNRSLSKLTYSLNFYIHGYEVFGYHLFNVFIHLAASITAYFLSLQFIRKIPKKRLNISLEAAFALISALIFALHPIQTDAVSYVTQRMASMAGLFVLLSIFFYIKFRESLRINKKQQALIYICFCIVSFILSILSKETGYIALILFFFIEVYFFQKREERYKYKFFFASIAVFASIVIYYIIRFGIPSLTNDFSRITYLFTQQKVIVKYIVLILFPINQHLSHLIIPEYTILSINVFLSALLHLSLLISAVILFRKGIKIISAGIVWFYITIMIESSIIPLPYLMNEYRLYLAIFGLSLIFAYLIIVWKNTSKMKTPYFITSIVLLILTILTINRNNIWQNEITLWSDNVKKSPYNSEALNALGYTYYKKGDKLNALSLLTESVKYNPSFLQARLNRGVVLFDLMKDEEALTDFNFILEKTPINFLALCNKGAIFARKGEMDEAKKWFDKSIAANPYYYRSHYDIGLYYYSKGNLDSALISFTKSVNLNRVFEKGYNNRAVIHLEKKNYRESIKDLDTALKIKPLYFDAVLNKAIVYRDLKDYKLSLYFHNLALTLNPQNERAFFERSLTFIRTKEYEFAIRDLENCIVLNPNDKKYEQIINQLRVLRKKDVKFKP